MIKKKKNSYQITFFILQCVLYKMIFYHKKLLDIIFKAQKITLAIMA
jgi:hypothetical protein